MNANYSEALEQQVAMLRLMTNRHALEHMARYWNNRDRNFIPGELRAIGLCLERAATIYVGIDVSRTLGSVVSQGVPPWTLTEAELLAPYGWCWFAANPGYADPNDEYAILKALSWATVWFNPRMVQGKPETVVSYDAPLTPEGESFQGIAIHPWYAHRDRPQHARPWTGVTWPFGASSGAISERTPAGLILEDGQKRDVAFVGQLFTALMRFMEQRILVAPQQRAERHAAKRLVRDGWHHEPLIRVVQLRRAEHPGYQPHDEAEHRDYSCQWIVRGHWRQQAYGEGHKERRPIWITPYVKGPPEKPLKAPRATVFAVTR